MTRAQGLRSSKRKPVKTSQDIIPEYCKENSPSILSQNSRRVAQTRKKYYCKENASPKTCNRKSVKSSQGIIPVYCQNNSPSTLSQNSRRIAQTRKKSVDCKENVSPKGCNRKSFKSSQEIIPEYCQNNSPSILSQNSRRVAQTRNKSNDCKENVSPKGCKEKLVKSSEDIISEYCKKNSPSMLTHRRAAQAKNKSDESKENILPEGLSSRRAAQAKKKSDESKENISPEGLSSRRAAQAKKKSDESKENISPEGLSSSSELTTVTTNQKVYSPIRKSHRHPNATNPIKRNSTCSKRNVLSDTTNSLQSVLSRNNVFHKIITVPQPSTAINTDYDNHIPVYKTAFSSKPLNGIEAITEKKEAVYEFEVDENEEPASKKKRKKRAYVRRPKIGPKALTINNIKYSSTESLASLPEKPVCKKKSTFLRPKCNIKPSSSVATLNDSSVSVPSFMSHPSMPLHENRCELSVLQETQSEQYPNLESTLLEAPVIQSPSSYNAVLVTHSQSHHAHFSPNPRCYGSKSGQTPNPYTDDQNVVNNSFSQQASSSTTNVSTVSHDFLSSTPCKWFSPVRHNSVFDDSTGMGRAQDASSLRVADDNCFGFDEPEGIEEPLLSPIKSVIDLELRRIMKCVPKRHDWEEPKPSIQEVIEMLKANIPKPPAKKETTMFVTSPQSSEPTSPTVVEIDSPVFLKPPRRSYERQRRVQYYNSDSDGEEENIKETKDDDTNFSAEKKCYKKANTTKTVKAPKVTKAKQRIAKEEEELEKMAALMNAQFQEIDKVDLVVE